MKIKLCDVKLKYVMTFHSKKYYNLYLGPIFIGTMTSYRMSGAPGGYVICLYAISGVDFVPNAGIPRHRVRKVYKKSVLDILNHYRYDTEE